VEVICNPTRDAAKLDATGECAPQPVATQIVMASESPLSRARLGARPLSPVLLRPAHYRDNTHNPLSPANPNSLESGRTTALTPPNGLPASISGSSRPNPARSPRSAVPMDTATIYHTTGYVHNGPSSPADSHRLDHHR
jgi:hypothetical protein